jgi:hypothetical protein
LALAGLHPTERLDEQRSVVARARLVELLEDLADGGALELRPALDALALERRGDEARAGAASDLRDADVAVDEQS